MSQIEWTDTTWNPVIGCTKVSTGCKNCYAKTIHDRRHRVYYPDQSLPVQYAEPFETIQLKPERLDHPLHWKKPRMIFVNSMSDLFHEDVPFAFIDQIFQIMFLAERHIFQILTKRPHRAAKYYQMYGKTKILWPLPNVWLGISCENQETADERIPILLQTPAAVKFLSCEPLLDEIELDYWFSDEALYHTKGYDGWMEGGPGIHWVIVGGESGPGYRPMKPEWAKSIIEQCQDARVPVFMKQMAGKKEIPEDLMIREYPQMKNELSLYS